MKNIMSRNTLLAALLGLGLASGLQAQEAPATEAQPSAESALPALPEAATNFSDEDLQRFVDVQPELQSVRMDYASRLEQAEDADAAAQLQEEAGQEMVAVLEENEMDVDIYNQIAMAIQQDETLRTRLEQMLEQ